MATFDDVVIKAKDVFEIASQKTGEVVSYSKLRLSIASVEGELTKAYKRLGIITYDMTKHGLEEPELVARCVEEIDVLKEKKAKLVKKLNQLRNNSMNLD